MIRVGKSGGASSGGGMTPAQSSKLSGVQYNATKNLTDEVLLGRENHTGTQPQSTIDGLPDALDSKVDKVAGKGLSDTNYTQAEKDKLAGLESSRFKGQFHSLAELQAAHPTAAAGDYANVDEGVGQDVQRYVWDTSDSAWIQQLGSSSQMTGSQIKQEYEAQPDTNAFTNDEKAKLTNIASEATKNRDDSENADKVHTHTTAQVTGLDTALVSKVDKVAGKGLSESDYTTIEKTKLADIEIEATKNRSDTLNADKLHTHVISDVTGLDAALSGKADKTTQVIAGTGLTGGGDLSTNRTLAVSYGTAAGTAAQGNDSRLSNSREWTAATISQAEAEAGTATTRSAFTAQRVRQAIVAWFNGISGALGRTILTRTTAAQVRGDLELGTAATTDNGTGFGQNIINFATAGNGSISYSNTLRNNTGPYNTAAGMFALGDNTTGEQNTAVGNQALQHNTTGEQNTAVGYRAHRFNTSGRSNTAVGRAALHANTTGDNNTAVGSSALVGNKEYNNCGGFGYDSAVTASNQIQLGNSETTVYAYGAVQNRSDARDKAEIRDTVLGLDFINAIRPVDYKLDMREDYRVNLGENPTEEQLEANKLANIQTDGTHTRKRYHHGVIAQEVAAVVDTLGIDFGGFQDHSKTGGDDVLSIGYEEFIAPLIKAVQELSTRVKELEGKAVQFESGEVE